MTKADKQYRDLLETRLQHVIAYLQSKGYSTHSINRILEGKVVG